MGQENLTIENNPQVLMFMRLWMASGPMVMSTIEGIHEVSEGRKIELPEIPGRDFTKELHDFYSALGILMDRLA
ncbi:MAG: hypothetical protein QGH90_02705 [Candidatus Poseidoniaceae archaeon]|jgi:hypothetical protein|nr:hypothetical protein [Candidatus Poseidoniaceae archaeon]MDP7000790.1 hypothetical protein [Candidatus Poseidoniaceae archaeon]